MKSSKTTLENVTTITAQAPRVPAYIKGLNAKVEFSDGAWWPVLSQVEYSQDCPACKAAISLPEVPAAYCPYCGHELDFESADICYREQGDHVHTRAILTAALDLIDQSLKRLS